LTRSEGPGIPDSERLQQRRFIMLAKLDNKICVLYCQVFAISITFKPIHILIYSITFRISVLR
jgi:hypothetical protein